MQQVDCCLLIYGPIYSMISVNSKWNSAIINRKHKQKPRNFSFEYFPIQCKFNINTIRRNWCIRIKIRRKKERKTGKTIHVINIFPIAYLCTCYWFSELYLPLYRATHWLYTRAGRNSIMNDAYIFIDMCLAAAKRRKKCDWKFS